MRDELSRDVRRSLNDPRQVCAKLGLKIEQRSASYCLVLCPSHSESSASCSVHSRNGEVAVKCHGCQFSGDVFTLIAAVHGLDVRSDFKEVLAVGAELAGYREQAEDLRQGRNPSTPVRRPSAPAPQPDRDYPPQSEVEELWATAQPVEGDREACETLVARRIDPVTVTETDLARVIHPQTHHSRLPEWARYKGKLPASRSWTKTGHRMIVPVFDDSGQMRSVRAWRVTSDASLPKRVPPSGHKASELVLANRLAIGWLRGARRPGSVVICEGEPDHLCRSIASPDECVIGIMSGSWHEGFAKRVPFGCEVIIRTHLDKAGERYADAVAKSVESRAIVRRWTKGNAA